MARKTKKAAEETRDRILNAAIDVFYAHGVGKSSLEQIAEAAGVTRGAVYWHFKNKIDIFSALHDRFHTSIMQSLLARLDHSNLSPLDQLQEFSVSFLKDLSGNEYERKILSLFSIKCDYSGEMASFMIAQNEKKQEAIRATSSFFIDAINKKEISADNDPAFLTLSFFCYLSGICNEMLRYPELFNIDKQAKALIGQFFKSIKI